MAVDRWLLPEGVEEALPQRARRLETARRRLLDQFAQWGYELVRPPFVEHLDSLLTGAGATLGLQTFRLVDQLSGRQLGVRADMTPQVARIDAHSLKKTGTARYCYVGSVLRTRPDALGGTRTPLQLGAELFGSAQTGADIEVLGLMLAVLDSLGVTNISLDLGHVGVYRALVAGMGLDDEAEAELFDIVQRKSRPDLAEFVANRKIDAAPARLLQVLIDAHGSVEVLEQAAATLGKASTEVETALQTLQTIATRVSTENQGISVNIDLGELRGYRYKTGIVFAAYQSDQGRELARGGRYDGVGEAFGRRRPATGFSADLNQLVDAASRTTAERQKGICVPDQDDPALQRTVTELRAAGERVLIAYPGDTPQTLGCDKRLVPQGDGWVIEPAE